ncbi:MAG: FecR domain-containing protein [Alistipes sp.]|nr:FecR domain-containing protein [Alistipes sp.]
MKNIDNIEGMLGRLLTGEITEHELIILNHWISADKRNAELVGQIKEYWSENTIDKMNLDHRYSYTIFTDKRSKQNIRRRMILRTLTAASAMIILTVTISLFHYNKVIVPEIADGLSAEIILDPDRSYILISDGSVHTLSTDYVTEGFYLPTTSGQTDSDLINELVEGRRQIKSLILPDKSLVTVNAGTRLSFPSAFSNDETRVRLNGEAYFDIISDNYHPFIIETKDCEVIVKGTTLNVRSYDDESSEITLLTGQVNVISSSHPISTELLPGEQLEISDPSPSKKCIDPTSLPAWSDGIFYFDNIEMSKVARQLSRWYGVDIVCAEDDKKLAKMSGIFSRNISLNDLITAIEKSMPISFTKTDKGYLIE